VSECSARIFGDITSNLSRGVPHAESLRVVTYRSVSDPEKLAPYAKLAGPAIAAFGARFLARGNAVVAREQGVKECRCRISELRESDRRI
jgi:hypothetical protein